MTLSDLKALVVRSLVLAVAVGTIWTAGRCLYQLEAWVITRPEYISTPADLRINRPDFMPDALFRRAVGDQHCLPAQFSAADPAMLRAVYESFEINPWVRRHTRTIDGQPVSVPQLQVRHSFPHDMTVEITYRRPVAVVAVPDKGYYWIDAEGVVLSDGWQDGDFPPQEGGLSRGPRGLPGRWRPLVSHADGLAPVTLRRVGQDGWQSTALIIEGVGDPPPPPGQPWPGTAVSAALDMLIWMSRRAAPQRDSPNSSALLTAGCELLRRQVRTLEVRREPLANFDRWALTLITPGGTRIDWGRPPDAEGHIDPPALLKLERLVQIVGECGGLDGRLRTLSLRATALQDGIQGVRWHFVAPLREPDEPLAAQPTPSQTPPRRAPSGPPRTGRP